MTRPCGTAASALMTARRSLFFACASFALARIASSFGTTALSTWQEAILPHSQWFFAESVVAGLAYLERARAEDRSGQRERALKDYREFLRRYDAPEPAQRGLVSEAAQAIERLSGASQTSRTVSPGVPQGTHQ